MKKLKSKLKIIILLLINVLIISQTSVQTKNTFAENLADEYFSVKIGDIHLTQEKPYYQNGKAVESCELGKNGCMVYYPNVDGPHKHLYLNNYNGPEFLMNFICPIVMWVEMTGDNTINSTKEYGIKIEEEENDDPYSSIVFKSVNETKTNLTINVNSETEKANGIRKTTGRVQVNEDVNLTINVDSKAPQEKKTTDEVTGITVEKSSEIWLDDTTTTIINNPTGNYVFYTDILNSDGYEVVCDDFNTDYVPEFSKHCTNYLEATYKITDGFGDVMPGNDFEASFYSHIDDKYMYDYPKFTANHVRTETTGYFRILPAIQGENATFDETINNNEKFKTAEQRMKNSLKRDYNFREITSEQNYAHNNANFDVDVENSYLINLTNPEDKDTIKPNNEYAFIISFKITDSDHGFAKTYRGPYGGAIINGQYCSGDRNSYNVSEDRRRAEFRYYLNEPRETLETPEEEPNQEETEPEETEKPETPIEDLKPEETLPEQIKTEPDISSSPVPNETSKIENPNTSIQSPKILIAIFVISSMIQFSYHIKSLRTTKKQKR